jgi:hypothetical protein
MTFGMIQPPAWPTLEVCSLPAQQVEQLAGRRSCRLVGLGPIVLARIGHRPRPLPAGCPPPRRSSGPDGCAMLKNSHKKSIRDMPRSMQRAEAMPG